MDTDKGKLPGHWKEAIQQHNYRADEWYKNSPVLQTPWGHQTKFQHPSHYGTPEVFTAIQQRLYQTSPAVQSKCQHNWPAVFWKHPSLLSKKERERACVVGFFFFFCTCEPTHEGAWHIHIKSKFFKSDKPNPISHMNLIDHTNFYLNNILIFVS